MSKLILFGAILLAGVLITGTTLLIKQHRTFNMNSIGASIYTSSKHGYPFKYYETKSGTSGSAKDFAPFSSKNFYFFRFIQDVLVWSGVSLLVYTVIGFSRRAHE